MITSKLKENKIKVYVITLSKHYMKGHPKAGRPTFFDIKLKNALFNYSCWEVQSNTGPSILIDSRKIHTIRGNFTLWEKRIQEIVEGKAVLSVRQWTGKPYRSSQNEIVMLSAQDGVGIQKVVFYPLHIGLGEGWNLGIEGRDTCLVPQMVANNDGLLPADFKAWFKGYDLTEPMAIIHFTKFRY